MARDKFITRIITIFFIGLLLLLGYLVLKSIIIAIIIGLLLSYIFHPVYRRINRKIKSKDFSAIILILGVIFIIAIPLWFLIPAVLRQAIDSYILFQDFDYIESITRIAPGLFTPELTRTIAIQINNVVSRAATSLINEFTNLFAAIPGLLLQIAVVLFTFYFSIRDAEKLKKYMSELSPFSNATENKFLTEFRHITDAIVYGQVLIGVIQGVALGIGLWLLGVSNPILLGVLAVIASIIPILGSWLVWLPVSLYLFATDHVFTAIALLLYGAIFVSSIDNVLRPIILSKQSTLPMSIALIGTIGGLYYLGIPGLVIGPLILAYLLIIIEFYKEGKLNDLFKE